MGYVRKTRQGWLALLSIILLALIPSTLPLAAAQSPKGRSLIAFMTADTKTHEMVLNLIDPVTRVITPLIKDGNFFFPVLSPDGKHIAFMGEHPKAGTRYLYVMDTDGSNLHRIEGAKPQFRPLGKVAWSPDSTQIFYGANFRDGRPAGFFRANLDGSDAEQFSLVASGYIYDLWIAVSPDGKHLAIRAWTDNSNVQVFVADSDGSNGHYITTPTVGKEVLDEITWSPDGKKALWNGTIGYTGTLLPIMISDSDGSNPKPLTGLPKRAINSLSWSPDGSQIAFVTTEPGDFKPDFELWIAKADGSGVRSLNIPINVSFAGTSWGVIPDEVMLPKTPVSFISVFPK